MKEAISRWSKTDDRKITVHIWGISHETFLCCCSAWRLFVVHFTCHWHRKTVEWICHLSLEQSAHLYYSDRAHYFLISLTTVAPWPWKQLCFLLQLSATLYLMIFSIVYESFKLKNRLCILFFFTKLSKVAFTQIKQCCSAKFVFISIAIFKDK